MSQTRTEHDLLGEREVPAALANYDLGLLPLEIADAIARACDEIIAGKYNREFVVDVIQGGAGTSTNMNANEVIANREVCRRMVENCIGGWHRGFRKHSPVNLSVVKVLYVVPPRSSR